MMKFTDPQGNVNEFVKIFANTQINNLSTSFLPTYERSSYFSISPVSQHKLITITGNFPNKLTAGDDLVPSFLVRSVLLHFP